MIQQHDDLVTIQDAYARGLAKAAARENEAARRAGRITVLGPPVKRSNEVSEQHLERAKGQVLDLLALKPQSKTDMVPSVTGSKHLLDTTLNALIVEGRVTRDNHRTGQKILYRLAG